MRLRYQAWRLAVRLVTEGGAGMIVWILAWLAGPMVLAGFAGYVIRGPRRHRRMTCEQLAELQVLAEIERHEDPL